MGQSATASGHAERLLGSQVVRDPQLPCVTAGLKLEALKVSVDREDGAKRRVDVLSWATRELHLGCKRDRFLFVCDGAAFGGDELHEKRQPAACELLGGDSA